MTRRDILRSFLKSQGMSAAKAKAEMSAFFAASSMHNGECVITAYLNHSN